MSEETNTPKRKKRITKEELKKLLSYRKRLITLNRKAFSAISKEAEHEYDEFLPCEKCKFLKKNCHSACGILMKHRHKSGQVTTVSYGNGGRFTTESEFLDTTGVSLGLSEEVDSIIQEELNGTSLGDGNDGISMEDIASYEVEEDGE